MTTSLVDYYERLSRHDWQFEMSDDAGSYQAGNAEHRALAEMSKESADHATMWRTFATFHYGHGEQPQKPVAA